MIPHDVPEILLVFGFVIGFLGGLVPAIVLAGREKSRRRLAFCKCCFWIGLVFMLGMAAVAANFDRVNFAGLICFALPAVIGMLKIAWLLAKPPFHFDHEVHPEIARRIRRLEEQSRALTPQEVVRAYSSTVRVARTLFDVTFCKHFGCIKSPLFHVCERVV